MSFASRLCQVFYQLLAVLALWSPDGFALVWAASPGGEVDLRSLARRRKLQEQGASPGTLNRRRIVLARLNGEDHELSPPAGLFSPVTPDQGNPAAASTTDGRSGNKRDGATKSTTSVPFLKVRPHDPDTDEAKGVVENASFLTKTVLCGGAVLAKLLWTLASFYLPGRLLAWARGRPTEVLRQRPLQNLEWMVRTFPFNFDMVLEMDKDEYDTILRKITNPELRKEAERATSFVEVTHLKHDVTMQLHLPAKEKLPEGEKWKAEYSGLYDDLTGSGDTWTKRGAAHIVLRKVAVPASPPAETGVPPVLQNKVASVLFGLSDKGADAAERSRGGLVATLHGSRATDERAGVRVENTFWYFPADNTRYYPAPKGSEGVVPISLYDEKVRDAARGKSSASVATSSAKVVKAAVTSIVARIETQNWHVLRKLVRLLLAKAPIAIPNHVCQLDPLLFACLGSKQPFRKIAAGRSTCPVPSTTTLPTAESGCADDGGVSFSKQLSYDSVPEDTEILPSGRTAGVTLTHAAGDQGAAAGTGGTAGGEHFSGRDVGGIAKSSASTGIAAPFKTGTKAPNVSEAEGDMELWAAHIHPEENNLALGAEEHKLNGWMGMNVNQQLQQAECSKANPPLPTPKAFGSSRANKYYYPTGRAPPPQQQQKPGEASMDSSGCPQDEHEEDAPFPIRGPKFVSHHGVRGLPMFGAVCSAWGGFFVDRDDAESRKACAQAILAHCDDWASEMSRAVDDDSTAGHFCNDGEDLASLILFPEGGLTNGEFVGDFKGGAAAHPTAKVRPVLLKYLGPETSCTDREGDAAGGDHAGNMAEVQYYATPAQLSAVLEAAKSSHRKQMKENDESSTSPAASSEWTSDDAEDEEDASVRELREKLLKTTLTMDKKDLQQRSTGTWFARHVIPESFCGKRKVVMRFGKVQERDLEAHGQASFLQLVQEKARQEFLTLPSSVKSLAEGTNA